MIYVIVSAPGQPRNIKAKVLSHNRIEVSWLPPTDSANIRSYNVYFNDLSVMEHPNNSYVLEDLIPDTAYHIQVSATTNFGEGEKSPMTEVKTSPLGKCKQYVGGVVKYPFCKQKELVVQCSTVKHCYHSVIVPLSLSSTELLCYNLFDDRSSQVKTRSECPLMIKKNIMMKNIVIYIFDSI